MKTVFWNKSDKVSIKRINQDYFKPLKGELYTKIVESNDEFVDIFGNLGGVMVEVGSSIHYEQLLTNEWYINLVDSMCYDLEAYIRKRPNPSRLHIRAFKEAGLEYKSLEDERSHYLKKMEQNELKEAQEQIEKELQDKELRMQKIEKEKAKFIDNQEIAPEYFLELCKLNDIKVPIRTIGAVKKWVTSVSVSEDGTAIYKRYGKKYDSQVLFEKIKELYNKLK